MYCIEIKTSDGWSPMRPSGSGAKPYLYPTREEASRAARICYPDQVRSAALGGAATVRVVEAVIGRS